MDEAQTGRQAAMKQKVVLKQKPTQKVKRQPDKARKEYDERLVLMNQNIRDMMNTKLGDPIPTCPTCKSNNAKSLTPRKGLLVGIKPCYKCLDCKRTYVLDDARYRNIYLKLMAVLLTHPAVGGGPQRAQSAMSLLHDYGINADYTDIMRMLKRMVDSNKK